MQRSITCFCNTLKRAESWLIGSGAKVQADAEWLASPHDQTICTVEISTMVHVVVLTLQVPTFNVQSLKEEKNTKKKLPDKSSWCYSKYAIYTVCRLSIILLSSLKMTVAREILVFSQCVTVVFKWKMGNFCSLLQWLYRLYRISI